MSFVGKLFGTDTAVEQTIGLIGKVADEAFYTDQEKAEDRAAVRRETQSMVIEWLKSTTGSALSRRLIALSITSSWLFMHLLATFMEVAGVWVNPTTGKGLVTSAHLIDSRLDGMTGAVMLILGFYFAAPYMGDIAGKALERFGKPKEEVK